MISTEYFIRGTEPTTVSTRYKQLNNTTNLILTENTSTVTLNWDAVPVPTEYTLEHLENYFQNHYGTDWEDYLQEQLEINSTELGVLGYDIYYKNDDNIEVYLTTTTDTTLTINKPEEYGEITYIIKTAWSIFKDNNSEGIGVVYEHEEPDVVTISVNNPNNILTVGTPYIEYSVIVYINGIATSITPSDKTITNIETDLPVQESNFTNTVGTYSVKYTISHENILYYAYRTVTVNNPIEG
jgi:hypothetical protein